MCTDQGQNRCFSEQIIKLIDEMRSDFDYIIIDCPAGIEQGFKMLLQPQTEQLLLQHQSVSAIRDADRVIGLLEANEITSIDLIINRHDMIW